MSITQEISNLRIVYVMPEEIEYFTKLSKNFNIKWKPEDRKNGVFPISKSYVGYLITPKRRIDLQPKYSEISMEHIFRIYLFVYGYKTGDNGKILDISSYSGNIDVAKLFLQHLERNIKMGILRTYRKEQMYSKRISGKIDSVNSYTRFLKNKKKFIDSKKSLLTLDNLINNMIVSALDKLIHLKKYASHANLYLSYFNIRGTITNGSETLNNINFNSLNERYRQTLLYASMIIDQLDYDDIGDKLGSESFILNFDRLFEDFVAKVLIETPNKRKFIKWDNSVKFADIYRNDNSIETRDYLPDLIYDYNVEDEKFNFFPSAKGVLDIKNKAYTQFKNSDVYQILTYKKLLNSQKMILLYPSFRLKKYEVLQLQHDIFEVDQIYACFIDISEDSGDNFLKAIDNFVFNVELVLNL